MPSVWYLDEAPYYTLWLALSQTPSAAVQGGEIANASISDARVDPEVYVFC